MVNLPGDVSPTTNHFAKELRIVFAPDGSRSRGGLETSCLSLAAFPYGNVLVSRASNAIFVDESLGQSRPVPS